MQNTETYQKQTPTRRKKKSRRKAEARNFLRGFWLSFLTLLLVIVVTHSVIGWVRAAAVTPDTVPPVISGELDLITYAGDEPPYGQNVTVTDDTDELPTLTIDSSAVDLNTPGTYRLRYTAADASENFANAEGTLTVLEKQPGYVSIPTIYAAVDQRLADFITEDMDQREQVEAVYAWTRHWLGYSGKSDRSDYLQAAYSMMTQRTGDCFGYFAVTKLMLERLGIPNMDVRKVKNFDTDSDHFWSLVSVDGGETWYHLDTTPRWGEGDNFCLVTDAFLDAYSAEHRGSHNRDTSLYPATPEA